jgi:pimeloyl-ACP methyl ester carboxylesterase
MADAPDVDREMLRRPEIREIAIDSLREAFASGPFGWFDDSWAISQTWGFELRDVSGSVHMWYGEIDRHVPIGAVRKMASGLNVGSFELIPGAGHLGWLAREEHVLRSLLDGGRRNAR